jgi:hypothetical protein
MRRRRAGCTYHSTPNVCAYGPFDLETNCSVSISVLLGYILFAYVPNKNTIISKLCGQLPVPEPININGERFVMRRAAQ